MAELSKDELARYSTLAGALTEPVGADTEYRVRYRSLLGLERRHPARTFVITGLCMLLEIAFVVWLLQPSHLPRLDGSTALNVANAFVVFSIAVMELMRMVNVISLSLASLAVRNPVPVRAPAHLRVAFATTIVPSKEPIDVVRRTLQAAREIVYDGTVDVWLLDEEDDPAVKRMCTELGVNHFTRHGVEEWNQKSGPLKARSKHGNYNAWVAAHGDDYDVLANVDPDHVPVYNYLERLLGYFRDADVAYVVGPQNYANCESTVTMGAESQQFPFHSVIQRASNLYNCAMLVGTNNAIRISALQAIGGLRDSVTEDMATGFQFHTRRNKHTGHRWKSVYTPDVLAHGEGPATWTDYFSQQMRWSRGTFEVLRHDFWRRFWRLHPGQLLHYGLITTFYPSMAIAWIFGAIGAVLYLGVGASGIHVPINVWIALYVDTAALQFALYAWNRRYNVSPYEVEGSFGLIGMLMSVLSSPVYASALIASFFGRPARFIVTPKGTAVNPDRLLTFRRHLQWGGVIGGALLASLVLHHASFVACFWPTVAFTICMTPIALWRHSEMQSRQADRAVDERVVRPLAETSRRGRRRARRAEAAARGPALRFRLHAVPGSPPGLPASTARASASTPQPAAERVVLAASGLARLGERVPGSAGKTHVPGSSRSTRIVPRTPAETRILEASGLVRRHEAEIEREIELEQDSA